VLRLFYAALGAALLLAARPALANGRFPASNQIVFSPSDPCLIVLRTSYGILPSHDNGTSWQFICEDALGLPSSAPIDPELGLTAKNALVAAVTNDIRGMGSYLGLDVSPDTGCTWSCVGGPLAHQAVSDLVVRPDAPDDVLAVTSTYRLPDAGGGTSSQVFESTDDGANWSPIGSPIDPTVAIETIDVVRGDPSRVYLSGTRGVGNERTAALFVSMNKGNDWTERPLPMFDPTKEEFLWIAAVDPMNADRVYVRTSAPINAGGASRLYVTTDAGQSFQMVLDFPVPPLPNGLTKSGIGELLGFALSPDGSKVYAGSKEQGLLMAAKSDLKFKPVNTAISVQCLATRGSELWACSDAKSGFIIGVSTDDGAHFAPKMKEILSLNGPIACGSGSAATLGCGAMVSGAECKAPFDMFCQSYGTCQPDSPPAQCPAPKPKASGCACSTLGSRTAGGMFALVVGLALALKRRRTKATLVLALLVPAGLGSTACSKGAPEPTSSGLPLSSSPAPSKLTTSQNLRSVWGASDSDLWVVGDKGTIEHFDGRGWSESNSDTTEDLTGIYGTAANDVWVSTQQGSVLHWDGSSWGLAVAMAQTTLLGIWASGPTDVWAVGIATADGDAGLVRHWNGARWETTIVPNSTSVWSVTGMGPNEVWIAGSQQNSVGGFVFRGNGTKFDGVGYGGPSVRGLWVIAPNDVWVAPYQGAMQHYDGATWMASTTTAGPLLRVAGSASGEVWAVGLGGAVLHYQGGTWSTPPSRTTDVLWSVWSTRPNSVWAVGNGGTVIRWTGSAWTR
jgi:MYXO-CTERM domain-containing protein